MRERHLELPRVEGETKERYRGDEEREQAEDEEIGDHIECFSERVDRPCAAAIICCLLSSSLSWYCWGLAVNSADGPFITDLEVRSHISSGPWAKHQRVLQAGPILIRLLHVSPQRHK